MHHLAILLCSAALVAGFVPGARWAQQVARPLNAASLGGKPLAKGGESPLVDRALDSALDFLQEGEADAEAEDDEFNIFDIYEESPDIEIPYDLIADLESKEASALSSKLPSAASVNQATITAAVAKWRKHDKDCGSAEVQVAIANEKIKYLTKHLLANKYDVSSRRGLNALVNHRRKFLNYLYEHDRQKATKMIQELGIRFRPPGRLWDKEAKYNSFTNSKSGTPDAMSKPQVPNDAKEFARKMGVDLKGLEAEAEDLWAMLDEMAEKSIDDYHAFIRQQVADQKLAEEGAVSGKAKDDGRYLRPNCGFSVQTTTLSGDGLKIRETDDSGASAGKIMYINICSHAAVATPLDAHGVPLLLGNWKTKTDDIQIPLVVGQVRNFEENSKMVIDVLVNAVVLDRCFKENSFKDQLVELVMSSVVEECAVKLKSDWILSPTNYIGGRGIDKNTPVLFTFDINTGRGGKTNPDREEALMQSPSMLIGALKQERQKFDHGGDNITIQQPKLNLPNEKCGEIDSAQRDESKATLLKKGFLDAGNRKESLSLYPEGSSSEPGGGDKGGIFQRLMNRCQVIDPSNISMEPDCLSKPMLAPAPTREETVNMEKLLGQADDEWFVDNVRGGGGDISVGDFSNTLDQMSKILLGSGSFPPPTTFAAMDKMNENFLVTGDLVRQGRVNVISSMHAVEVTVTGLKDLDLSSEVILDVAATEINLKIRGELVNFVQRQSGNPFDAQSATAVFSKKKKTLCFKISMSTEKY